MMYRLGWSSFLLKIDVWLEWNQWIGVTDVFRRIIKAEVTVL
jgi:hypothetical protein